MFRPVEGSVRFPELERAIGEFWKREQIYEKSLAQRAEAPKFVFFEGPPTANGLPHPGHCLTRAIKDLFPRYRTMRGYRCDRKAGWDTHGLPVEVEVCKELGIHSKEEIEAYGVEKFIHLCLESVFRYTKEWERLTERLGFWIHLDEAYVTYHQSYVESVWWALKNLFDRGLLYQGHKIVWWWAQGGTALSSGEVGQGYREVADPSVYVRFPVLMDETAKSLGLQENTSLIIWTTTPWTLPSNTFAAVHPDFDYAIVHDEGTGEYLILAEALVSHIAQKLKADTWKVEKTLKGSNLLGLAYEPPFPECFYNQPALSMVQVEGGAFSSIPSTWGTAKWLTSPEWSETQRVKEGRESSARSELVDSQTGTYQKLGWCVLAGEFVTLDSGTGIVHEAPAFGEVDYQVWVDWNKQFVKSMTIGSQRGGIPLFCAVGPDGKFTSDAPKYEGRWVKDCDREIIRDLKERKLLLHQEQYLHEYPFCWRAEQDPLIQYPRKSWFIRTSQFKDEMLANNEQINWLPEHIKNGRFGNFLETNVDWALSRERYWGTPLPIWVCEKTGYMEAVASYDELLAKPGVQGVDAWTKAKAANPKLSEHLKVHKPYIDEVTYTSPKDPASRMRRVPEVIDCWFDSGAMPFAQWGYRGEEGPSEARQKFHEQFPADFISEAIDQTRGWFYSQLAISTLLFGGECKLQIANCKLQNETASQEPTPHSALHTPHFAYPHPFRTCIVLGLMLAEWWETSDGKQRFLTEAEARDALGPAGFTRKIGKMSKQLRNYRPPEQIFDTYGADALRWYFFANQAPWNSIIYSEQAIKESIPEFLLRLWNVYSFFVIYANIDGFDPARLIGGAQQTDPAARGTEVPHYEHAGVPDYERPNELTSDVLARAEGYTPIAQRSELDRWILSELNRTAAEVTKRMDAYDNFGACGQITAFVDALSNWYVRRSRDRFWSSEQSADKRDAYWTLYECLLTTSKIIAPFVPFLAEALWQNLAVEPFCSRHAPRDESEPGKGQFVAQASSLPKHVAQSVHLCTFPSGIAAVIDEGLSARMNLVREIVSLGRSARMQASLKVRQPLAKVEVILTDRRHLPWLEAHSALVCEELNVKEVDYAPAADQYIDYTVLPDLKRLGPRLGKRLPALRKALAEADAAALLAELNRAGKVELQLADGPVGLDSEDLQVRLQAKPGWAAAQGACGVVVLSTELTPDLVAEGLAREFVHAVQTIRKEISCDYTDRLELGIVTASDELRKAIEQFAGYIKAETLAVQLVFEALPGVEGAPMKLAGHEVTIYVKRLPQSR